MDIVERLRIRIHTSEDETALTNEAADEIERLREQVDFERKSRNDAYDELKKQDAEIERLRDTIANAAQLNARLMDIINLAKRMKTAAFNHWCEKTPETNGILVDLQFEFEDALEGLKRNGHWTVGKGKSGQSSINDGRIAEDEMSKVQSGKKKRE